MTVSTPRAPTRWTGLALAISLALILLVLSFARIVGDAQSAMIRTSVLNAVFSTPIWGTALARNLALFAGALLLLHVAFGLVCWCLGRVSSYAWQSAKTPVNHHVLLWFLALTFALLASNAANVPHSSLGAPYARLAQTKIAAVEIGVLPAFAILAALLLTLGVASRRYFATHLYARRPAAVGATLLALAGVAAVVIPRDHPTPAASAQPNVILIGLDSLRCDLAYGAMAPRVAPHLHQFLSQGVSFTNALTPLARTFPSMASILTGRRPHSTGAVMNLLPRDAIHEGDTLASALRRAGYHAVYATDEVRFSNIDETYGFDDTVNPPIGASEFLISFMADTPLSNQLMNTWIGAALFPHLHANRGAAVTYDPDRFLKRVASEVEFRQPLFLTTHLTLPHWPYRWIDAPFRESKRRSTPKERPPTWPDYYLDVVRRSDQQFADLLALLEGKGVLENAIVVVYSDHGETFGIESESMVSPSGRTLASIPTPTWGHGTSVISPHQYRVVLGMRGFGTARAAIASGARVDSPVATYDIAPTLAELVKAPMQDAPDGRSLAALLRDESDAGAAFADRIRFTETEFNPSGVATASGKIMGSSLERYTSFYDIDPKTDRLQLKRARLPALLYDRQYAAIGPRLLLAAIPAPSRKFKFVVVDQQGGQPQRLAAPPAPDAPAEILRLWEALHAEFQGVFNADYFAAPTLASTAAPELREPAN